MPGNEAPGAIEMSPIGVYLHAKSFQVAAEALVRDVDEGRIHLRFSSPIHHMFSHAIENVLKSFLMTQGFTNQKLAGKAYGHHLSKLYAECISHRLSLNRKGWADRKRLVELISSHHAAPYTFRYLKIGLAQVPSNKAFSDLCETLFDAIHPFVHENKSI